MLNPLIGRVTHRVIQYGIRLDIVSTLFRLYPLKFTLVATGFPGRLGIEIIGTLMILLVVEL